MLLNRTHSATLDSMNKSKQANSDQDKRHAPAADLKAGNNASLEFDQAQVPREGRLGGIDYGTVRIGIATCDPSQTWATPYDTYACRSPALDDAYFRDLVASQNLVGWVIGLPIHCDGQESQKSKEVRKFAERLANATSLPCCFYDERFSTREARRLLQDSGLGHQKKKSRLDRLAAHLILSHFLDSRSCRSATEIPESSSTHPLED